MSASTQSHTGRLDRASDGADAEPMTPGRRALIEAARLETARVYGSVQREHREHRMSDRRPQVVDDNIEIVEAILAGTTISEVVETFCVDYATVRAIRKRVMARGAA